MAIEIMIMIQKTFRSIASRNESAIRAQSCITCPRPESYGLSHRDLPGVGDQSGLFANTTVATPLILVILPSIEGAGALPFNTFVAGPPIAAILPGIGDPVGLLPNTTVAIPPILMILPSTEGAGALPFNTLVAGPPITVILPGNGYPAGLPPNTTMARPPVSVQFDPGP